MSRVSKRQLSKRKKVLSREAKLKLIIPAILADARAARSDMSKFVSFVAKEETTKKKVRVLPHQSLMLKFIQAHKKCVIYMPPGGAKTFTMAMLTLYLLGNNVTERGVILSAAESQARKVLAMVKDYIEASRELRLVFPELKPSDRRADSWSQSSIVVNRPRGIRDPSLKAIGLQGALPGSRLSWIVIDDVLNLENTYTGESRDKVSRYIFQQVLTRIDAGHDSQGRIVMTNTAHHEDDVQNRLVHRRGWPALKIGMSGNIMLYNTDWDSDMIRPSEAVVVKPEGPYRLVAHDKLDPSGKDIGDRLGFWPSKFTPKVIEQLKRENLPETYEKIYEQKSTNYSSARCDPEWIESCKVPGLSLVPTYTGPNVVATGIDLAVGRKRKNDRTALVTVEFREDGMRKILDVDFGRWSGPTIVDKAIDKADRYNSILRVENNAAQDYLLQFIRQRDKAVRVVPHTTGMNKVHPEFGLEGVLVGFKNRAWMFPCDEFGNYSAEVRELVRGILDFKPTEHPSDLFMALWFAEEQGRKMLARQRLANDMSGFGVTDR